MRRVFIFRSTLADGGADRVTLTLLEQLDRARFTPELVLLRREGVLLSELPDGVPVHVLHAARVRSAWLALAALLRRERPDVLLSMTSGGNVTAALAHALAGTRTRLVVSERNTFTAARRERYSRWLPVEALKRIAYRRADAIIAVSAGVAKDLIDALRLPPERVSVIYNPVVDDRLHASAHEDAAHPWFADGVPVVLAAGRLIPQKDFPTLLQAFARLQTPARLMILGEGAQRASLEALGRTLGIAPHVQLPGFMRNPFSYMRRCAVFVLSSRFEGLPGVLIQAMACGAPVIATDCPSGPAEILQGGRAGLLVPVGDAAALAAAIDAVLGDPGLRSSLSAAGTRRARDFRADAIVREYETALSGTT